jgi:hypothetical protein
MYHTFQKSKAKILTSVYFYAEMQEKIRTTNNGSFHVQKSPGQIRNYDRFHTALPYWKKCIEKCLQFTNFFLSNKKKKKNLQITQTETTTAFPHHFCHSWPFATHISIGILSDTIVRCFFKKNLFWRILVQVFIKF